jgi:hypothetical protein
MAQQLAMGVGVAGALVDVSADVDIDRGVEYSWGRESEFFDADPGRFSFTLNNSTGKYTPDNTAGGLATTLTEGMRVAWSLGGRLRAGRIVSIAPTFPGGESARAEVRVTAEDMLGDAGRVTMASPFTTAMVLAATPYLYWPLNDAEGSIVAVEQSGRNQSNLQSPIVASSVPTFGQAGFRALGSDTQMEATPGAKLGQFQFATAGFAGNSTALGQLTPIDYPTNSMGCWGAWFTPVSGSFNLTVSVLTNGNTVPSSQHMDFGINTAGRYFMRMGNTTSVVSATIPQAGVPCYVQMVVTNAGATSITGQLFVNGVSAGSSVYVPAGSGTAGLANNYVRSPAAVSIFNGLAPTTALTDLAHLSHTAFPVSEFLLNADTTGAGALTVIDGVVPEVALAALPALLDSAPIAFPQGPSVLDALNEVVKTEQGAINSTVTGTLLAPVEVLTVRERTRPTTITASFDARNEVSDSPQFVRDLSYMASTVTASGPRGEVRFTNSALVARVGSANKTVDVLNVTDLGLLAFAQDRLNRGANVQLRIASVSVDAMTTPTDRSAVLLALKPGDRHRFTQLPSTQLGFATWDGWLLGVSETHTLTEHKFTFYYQPVLADVASLGTSLFMSDGDTVLTDPITASATTISVFTFQLQTRVTLTEVPFTLFIGAEQLTVTAVSLSTALQSLTVIRGVNGTSATAHPVSDAVEVTPPSLYAF